MLAASREMSFVTEHDGAEVFLYISKESRGTQTNKTKNAESANIDDEVEDLVALQPSG